MVLELEVDPCRCRLGHLCFTRSLMALVLEVPELTQTLLLTDWFTWSSEAGRPHPSLVLGFPGVSERHTCTCVLNGNR